MKTVFIILIFIIYSFLFFLVIMYEHYLSHRVGSWFRESRKLLLWLVQNLYKPIFLERGFIYFTFIFCAFDFLLIFFQVPFIFVVLCMSNTLRGIYIYIRISSCLINLKKLEILKDGLPPLNIDFKKLGFNFPLAIDLIRFHLIFITILVSVFFFILIVKSQELVVNQILQMAFAHLG